MSITINAGADATVDFVAIHSTKAHKMWEKYYIGDLEWTDAHGNKLALNPKKKTSFRLQNKVVLSRYSFMLDFALPTPEHVLGLPVGKHLFLSAKINDEVFIRRYTPISLYYSEYDVGRAQFVIKACRPCERFPEAPESGVGCGGGGRPQIMFCARRTRKMKRM